jgi:hypothetical protein
MRERSVSPPSVRRGLRYRRPTEAPARARAFRLAQRGMALAVVAVLAAGGTAQASARALDAGPASTPGALSTQAAVAPSVASPYTSWWNAPIPADAPLASNSAQLADSLAYMVGSGRWQGAGLWGNHTAGVNTDSQTPPVWIAGPGAATIKVGFNNCQSKNWIDPAFISMMSAVPIPPGAVPSAGSDQEMVVYQPSTDTEWDLWKTMTPSTSPNGDWEACWGGELTGVTHSPEQMPKNFGVAASGLALQTGLITPADLQSGVIDHVVAIAIPLPQLGGQSWPATRNDGWATGPDAVMEGQRFRLDPAIDVTSLGLTPLGTMIARAAQTYGFVVRDFSTTVTAYADNSVIATSIGQPDPYPPYLGGKPSWDQLTDFPWSRLTALPQDYGKPSWRRHPHDQLTSP